MNFLDALRLASAVEDVKDTLAAINDLEVGEMDTMPIPEAKKFKALLVRGKNGRRVRITGVTYEVEA